MTTVLHLKILKLYPLLLQQAKLDVQDSVQLKKLLDNISDSQFLFVKNCVNFDIHR